MFHMEHFGAAPIMFHVKHFLTKLDRACRTTAKTMLKQLLKPAKAAVMGRQLDE